MALTPLAAIVIVMLSAATGCSKGGSGSGAPRPGAAASGPPVAASDPWSAAQLVTPADLATRLASASAPKPLLVHVGFRVLYQAGAIPGSRYLGPGSRPEGIAALRDSLRDVPREREIVLYCGCCPWGDCPNMRPAFRAAQELGFTHVRALYVAKNLDTDWVGKGYPVDKPAD